MKRAIARLVVLTAVLLSIAGTAVASSWSSWRLWTAAHSDIYTLTLHRGQVASVCTPEIPAGVPTLTSVLVGTAPPYQQLIAVRELSTPYAEAFAGPDTVARISMNRFRNYRACVHATTLARRQVLHVQMLPLDASSPANTP